RIRSPRSSLETGDASIVEAKRRRARSVSKLASWADNDADGCSPSLPGRLAAGTDVVGSKLESVRLRNGSTTLLLQEERLERSARLLRNTLGRLMTKEVPNGDSDPTIYEVGSTLWDRLETSRGLSSVLRPAEAIFPRDFRETANPPAISQEVPCKPTTAHRVRAFAE
ncbi:hypothetical protein ALC53_10964, partial [Atta colombica]